MHNLCGVLFMFSAIFEKLCEEAGIAPTRVLIELGIGKSALSNWKRGSEPSNRTKKQIADYFGVSVSELLAGKTNTTKKSEESDEMAEMLQEFRDNPDLRTLFCLGRGATPAELRQYINVIKALRGNNTRE